MAVTKALNSLTSIPGKQYVAPMVEGAGSNLGFGLKRREALVRTVDSDLSGGFFEEVVSTKRDNIVLLLAHTAGTQTTSGYARDARRGIIVRKSARRSVVVVCSMPSDEPYHRSRRQTGRSCTSLNVRH